MYERKKPTSPLVVFAVVVGLLVATAAGWFIYEKASDRIDRERLPALREERLKLDYVIFPPGDAEGLKGLKGTSEQRARYDELGREIDRILAKNPDLRRK